MKIVEFGAIGPGPFCAMLMADLGATVIRLERKQDAGLGVKRDLRFDLTKRNRPMIALDLKSPEDRDSALELVSGADALIEGFRPGAMERLRLGPDDCLAANPALIYGRMTGWGQTGPLAQTVGHDINYLALSGALSMIGSKAQGPAIPLNLVSDLGGGALYLAFGMLAAVMHARETGEGQVVDAAILDGVGSLLTTFHGFRASGLWTDDYESNFIDGGAPWYACYKTLDGKYVSVGAVERKFYAQLLDGMGLDASYLDRQMDKATWPEQKRVFAQIFARKTRDDWDAVFAGREACYAPVLDMDEALTHPQVTERDGVVHVEGIAQTAPAPRFSKSQPDTPRPPSAPDPDLATRLRAQGWAALVTS
ncbi:L-carnitine dehydratase/bile acid-inducible protein F [Rhodobacterales bacterium HTCC2654]|uniref:L-carnitine dehydratase/bile acid-inducible protein F n=1 Tax=Maritimibacter alkaliphilus HTCC2654 TaxID=314271 RepID=A3VLP0_9RHOB|nr:CaiB/BaiF CoA-transferase family protein [Maritimibacter alkaliphilus]EAQ10817.1 L-carnitine dehydratase/bile acid-inducible protein F [Rhodobacterales bacterium HTCC2654] [Maritimibacter alkaliphilus HTCC2654]